MTAQKLKFVKSKIPKTAVFKMAKDPVAFLNKHQKETGGLYRVDAPIKFVIASDQEAIRHILQKNWKFYEKGAAYDGFKLLLGDGILVSNGEKWKRNRKIIQPSFKREQIQIFAKSMNKSSEKWAEIWREKCKNGEMIEPKSNMVELAPEVLGLFILGEESGAKYKPKFLPLLQNQYDFVLNRNLSLLKMPLWLPLPSHSKFNKAKKNVDDMIYEIIEAKSQSEDDSMISMMLHAKDENGEQMSKQQVRDEFMTLFAAGFETTGSSMTWMFLLLAKHPELQEKIYQEIKDIQSGDVGALMKSPWLNAVVKESMRLYPAAWVVSRKCIKEDVFQDQIIPKGSMVFISIFGAHRDPKYWDNPEEFKPERFLEPNDNPSYMPYGVGPRMCIGNHFSYTQILWGLYHLIKNFKFELGAEHNYEIDPKISLKPDGDVLLRLGER